MLGLTGGVVKVAARTEEGDSDASSHIGIPKLIERKASSRSRTRCDVTRLGWGSSIYRNDEGKRQERECDARWRRDAGESDGGGPREGRRPEGGGRGVGGDRGAVSGGYGSTRWVRPSELEAMRALMGKEQMQGHKRLFLWA